MVRLGKILYIPIFCCWLVAAHADPQVRVQAVTPESIVGPVATRVLMIGETHYDLAPKRFLREQLESLQRLGFTHLGLEMINRSQQPSVEQRIQSWKEIVSLDWQWDAQGYVDVLSEAERLGIQVVALDCRDQLPSQTSNFWLGFVAEVQFRDNCMSQAIAETLKHNPSAKMITWTGALHSSYFTAEEAPPENRSLMRILEQDYGIVGRSIAIDPYAKGLSAKKYLKEFMLAHPSKRYYRAVYERDFGPSPTKALIATPKAESGYDGILLWDSH